MTYPNIAERVFHTPLLAAPAKAISFLHGLGPRITGQAIHVEGAEASAPVPPSRGPQASLLDDRLGEMIRSGRAESFRVIDGAAVIPITGTLIHRGAWVGSYSGETSYEGIAAQIEAAASAPGVRGIALEIDSHGGQVAGCFELADLIRETALIKPVHAFVCDHAYSAAYALASQASSISITRTGGAGSIGVICLHADYSGQMEQRGIKVTVISAGAHKADENPYAPLPDDVRANLEAEMEYLRGLFAETVGAGRGAALSSKAALETEARCLIGAQAVEAGLADEVANSRDSFERFVAQINGRSEDAPTYSAKTKGRSTMTKKPEATTDEAVDDGTKVDAPAASQPDATPLAAAPEATAPAAPAPSGAGAKADTSAADERARIAAIMTCDEAKGREDLAKSFAFGSDMDAETAKKHLAAAPKAASANTLSAHMEGAESTDLDVVGDTAAATGNPVREANAKRYKT